MSFRPARTRKSFLRHVGASSLTLLTACGTTGSAAKVADGSAEATGPAPVTDGTAGDAGPEESPPVTYGPDGAIVACGADTCDGPVVTPLATLAVCCAQVGPGGFGDGGGCGLTDPPPFGMNQCAPLKGPGVLDPSCPVIVRPLQTYPGCCTPQGLCGGFANKLFGYTVNYGCGVENAADAQACTPPSPDAAVWKPDPVAEAGACMPVPGDCVQQCACAQCAAVAPQCLNDPGCVAIVNCTVSNNCVGGACIGPCSTEISQSPNSSANSDALNTCLVAKCSQCLLTKRDAGH